MCNSLNSQSGACCSLLEPLSAAPLPAVSAEVPGLETHTVFSSHLHRPTLPGDYKEPFRV